MLVCSHSVVIRKDQVCVLLLDNMTMFQSLIVIQQNLQYTTSKTTRLPDIEILCILECCMQCML